MTELADPTLLKEGFQIFSIQQISTELSRYFTRKGLKIAPWVHDYCPPKYKDGSKIHNSSSDVRAAEPRGIDLLISFGEKKRELLEEIQTVSNADLNALYDLQNEIKNKCESIARDRKILLVGHENREQYRTRKLEPKITTYLEACYWFQQVAFQAYIDLVHENPPPLEKEKDWINGLLAAGRVYLDMRNEKRSLTTFQWLDRIKYLVHQSKHGAAVFEPVETQICDNCWDDKNMREREGCNAEMEYDYSSPTHWRCSTCGGISGKWRTLTREQCGDNKIPVITYAQELIHYLLHNYEAHLFYAAVPQKLRYGRKIRLGGDLSKKA
jgi:hypothetical protein